MTRTRLPSAFLLLALLGIAAGCAKKPEAPPEVKLDPSPAETGRDAESAAKAEAVSRLKQIGLAMHKYHDTYSQFPAGYATAKGAFGLSWRVTILPYLDSKEDAALLKEFKLNEPWDSEHNKKLIDKMPRMFESPGKSAPAGRTYLRSFMGGAAFIQTRVAAKGTTPTPRFPTPPGLGIPGQRMAGISDGTSGTLAVVEAAEPVEWTRPDDLPFSGFGFDPMPVPVPKLGGVFPSGFHGLMCDGAVHFFPESLTEKSLRAMITTSGGEVLDGEVANILFPPKPPQPKVPNQVPDNLPDTAARRTVVANLQQIVKGLHDHNDAYGFLPAGIAGKGVVGLSWRVQVLPFIGEEKLYKEFKPTEAWDSDHNKALLEKMPAVFASPGKASDKGNTFVRTTQGPGGILRGFPGKGIPGKMPEGRMELPPGFEPGRLVPGINLIGGMPDGTSNTILVVEAGEAVPWTKPDELFLPSPFDPKGGGPSLDPKLPPLGGAFGDGFHVAMGDGVITFYKTDFPTGALAKMFCPADGWIVEPLIQPEKILYSIPHSSGKLEGKPPTGNPSSVKGGAINPPPK